jgi:hypothetical protein
MTAHLLAALGSAIVLIEAENLLDRWAALLHHALGMHAPELPGIPGRAGAAVAVHTTSSILRSLAHALVLRGPPAHAVSSAHALSSADPVPVAHPLPVARPLPRAR